MKKKCPLVMCILILIFCLCACGKQENQDTQGEASITKGVIEWHDLKTT